MVSGPGDEWLADEIILDLDPQGVYDVGFSVKTQQGAFEYGGRITGIDVPVRTPTLPFWLNPDSRKRFQKMWGSPGFFRTVKMTWTTPSGPRFLMLRLSKEITYTTEDGFDADDEKVYHAVVVPVALNPMFEGVEDATQWTNPDDRFTIVIVATGGTYKLAFAGQTTNFYSVGIVGTGGTFTLTFGSLTTTPLPYNASTATVQAALVALASIGAGNATVSGSPGNYSIAITPTGALTGSGTSLTGSGHAVNITAGIPFNATNPILAQAISAMSTVGVGNVTVTGSPGNNLVVFGAAASGVLTGDGTNLTAGFLQPHSITIHYAPNTGYFNLWNPTDQIEWLEWNFDPAESWSWPDYSWGQELRWNRSPGADATRMIVSPELTQMLSVMSDPLQDTYVNADLSNAAGLFNGVEPRYGIPPYTASVSSPVVAPVICRGPKGAKVTLRQRRFWSAESGLE
jgi:hypothetical protein